MKQLRYKDKNGEYQNITPIVIKKNEFPDGGTEGQILTKTEDGVAWEDNSVTKSEFEALQSGLNDLKESIIPPYSLSVSTVQSLDPDASLITVSSSSNSSLSLKGLMKPGHSLHVIVTSPGPGITITIPNGIDSKTGISYINLTDETISIDNGEYAEINLVCDNKNNVYIRSL